MKIIFKDEALSELYENGRTEDRKYKKMCRNKKLIEGYQRAVSIMYDVESAEDLPQSIQFSPLRKIEIPERTAEFCKACKTEWSNVCYLQKRRTASKLNF